MTKPALMMLKLMAPLSARAGPAKARPVKAASAINAVRNRCELSMVLLPVLPLAPIRRDCTPPGAAAKLPSAPSPPMAAAGARRPLARAAGANNAPPARVFAGDGAAVRNATARPDLEARL